MNPRPLPGHGPHEPWRRTLDAWERFVTRVVASGYGPHPDDYVHSLWQRGQVCCESSATPTGITSSSSSVATTRAEVLPGDGKKRRLVRHDAGSNSGELARRLDDMAQKP